MSVLKRVWPIVWVLGLAGLTGLAGVAGGAVLTPSQDEPGQPGASAASSRQGEIAVSVTRIGVGGRARPGEWAALQVVLTNQTDRLREVLVRAVIPDPDGDRAAYERTIVSNPGAAQSVWLYVHVPYRVDTGTTITVTAHEAEESESSEGARFRAGRVLGTGLVPIAANARVDETMGMVYIVGDRQAALEQYNVTGTGMAYSATGHELTQNVVLQLADIPDRAIGLLSSDTLVWTSSGPGKDPTDLSRDQAGAIREWVRRGGHLVVVLPPSGQSWLERPDNPLADIMPMASPVLFESADPGPMRKLFTDDAKATFDPQAKLMVQVLRPAPEAGAYDAMPILNIPESYPASGMAGQPIAVRRLVGQGAVTVVGVNPGAEVFSKTRGAEADVFWNRLLGRRIDLKKPEELKDIANRGNYLGNRRERILDEGIGAEISMTAEAAAGLLLAFVVFGLYWLFAGPVGHFALKRRDLRRHSWLAFVGVAGIFTAIAWGGANVISAKRVSGQHLTLYEHVYGQPSQRTRTWVNIHVPRYGDVKVSAAGTAQDNGGAADDWHPMIAPWDDPVAGAGGWGGFPDSREYAVESREPSSLVVPFRSTAKQFRIDWAGPVRDGWGMPRPQSAVAAASPVLGKELQITKVSGPGRGWTLSGTLTHDLPGTLHDVVIVVVPHQDSLSAQPQFALVNDARAIKMTRWERGVPLDFAKDTSLGSPIAPNDGGSSNATQWLKGLLGVPSSNFGQLSDRTPTRTDADDLTALSFYSMLEPPDTRSANQFDNLTYAALRRATHTWDLGRWFTQPCIIVVGQLEDEASPTPVTVDGREVALTGRTVVRWVYPLTPEPPAYEPEKAAGPGESDGKAGTGESDGKVGTGG